MPNRNAYIGRFAPSPTGPLHLGSLFTAVASYVDARANRGQWLLRIEDIDPPREQAGATEVIISSLRQHGLEWDGEILKQSQRSAAYDKTLATLLDQQQAFYCSCSRSQLAENGGIHRGDCIAAVQPGDAAIRLRTNNETFRFNDLLQGMQIQSLADSGDFVLRRRDGFYAYQLAVVVDDIDQGVNTIVRGIDLLDSSARQLLLYQRLHKPAPTFLHLPIIVDAQGDKLSKQAFAPAIDDSHPEQNLYRVLELLNQATPPRELDCKAILSWACKHWRRDRIPHSTAIGVSA